MAKPQYEFVCTLGERVPADFRSLGIYENVEGDAKKYSIFLRDKNRKPINGGFGLYFDKKLKYNGQPSTCVAAFKSIVEHPEVLDDWDEVIDLCFGYLITESGRRIPGVWRAGEIQWFAESVERPDNA